MGKNVGKNIEKLSTPIFYVNDDLLILHETVFGHKDKDGGRRTHISKHLYKSKKYSNVTDLCSFKISTADYLILQPFPKDSEKKVDRVLVTQQSRHALKRSLNDACSWIKNDYDKIFIEDKNGELTVSEYGVKLSTVARPLVQGAALEFRPAIVKGEAGVVMFLSNYTDKIFMTSDEIMSLEDFVMDFSFATNSKISTLIERNL